MTLSARSRKGRASALPCGAPWNEGPKSVAHPPPKVRMTFCSLSGIIHLKPENVHAPDHVRMRFPEGLLRLQQTHPILFSTPRVLTQVGDQQRAQSLYLPLRILTHAT